MGVRKPDENQQLRRNITFRPGLRSKILAGVVLFACFCGGNASAWLVGHWPLNDTAGQWVATDTSGSGMTAVCSAQASVTFGTIGAPIGSTCVSFSGGNLSAGNELQIPAFTSLNGANQLTISLWFQANSSQAYTYEGLFMTRAVQDNLGAGRNYGMALNGTTATGPWRPEGRVSGGQVIPPSSSALGTLPWMHLALVWDGGSTASIFTNGVLAGTQASLALTGITNNGTWYMGWDPAAGFRHVAGSMSDVAVWNEALSAGQIYQIYTNGLRGLDAATAFGTNAPSVVRVETAGDGSGVVYPGINLVGGDSGSVTVYAVVRDNAGHYLYGTNVYWSLVNVTGGVASGDLVASEDSRRATFTPHLAGTANIQAVAGTLGTVSSGQITVRVPTVYYVATNGNDGNLGTLSLPFQTLSGAANHLNPGDTLYVRGGTYRETLTMPVSGLANAPITIAGYSNEVATISGADLITNTWTVYSNKIYQAQMPWTMDDVNHWWHNGTGGNQVFVDGNMMEEARWPNLPAGRNPAQVTRDDLARPTQGQVLATNASQDTAQYTLAGMPCASNAWVGAYIYFLAGSMWTPMSGTIIASSNGVVTFQCPHLSPGQDAAYGNQFYYYPRSNDAFYVWGQLSMLNTNQEWFRDTNSGTLYLWTPSGDSPTNHAVEAKHRDFAVDFNNQSNVKMRNLCIFAAGIYTEIGCSNILMDGINAQYVSHATWFPAAWADPVNYQYMSSSGWVFLNTGGIWLQGNNNVIQNTVIQYSATTGIEMWGNNMVASNNYVGDVGYTGTGANLFMRNGSNLTATANRIKGTGYLQALDLSRSTNVTVTYNDVSDSAKLCMDNGTIWGGNVANVEIGYNLVHDNHGINNPNQIYFGNNAIYFQDFLTNLVIHHNVSWNTCSGIYLDQGCVGTNVWVLNNTIVGREIRSVTGTAGAYVWIQNNICTNIFAFNNWAIYAGLSNWVYTVGNESVNPGFVNPSTNNGQPLDFSLNYNSPCINAGLSFLPYTYDFVGSAPDVGAYEYGGVKWQAGLVQPTPGWQDVDIGVVGLAGSGVVNGNVFTVQGAGSDIGGVNDSLNYLYQPMSDDGAIVARLAGENIGGGVNDKVGLMIRETTNSNAKMATVVLNNGYGKNRLGYRSGTGNTANWIDGTTMTNVPVWFELARTGNTFTGYVSTNGAVWITIGATTISMSNNIMAGLAVCSRDANALNTSVFDNVTVPGQFLAPVITGVSYGAQKIILGFGGAIGQSYHVLAATNLTTPLANWTVMTNGVFGGSMATLSDNATTNKACFYRITSP